MINKNFKTALIKDYFNEKRLSNSDVYYKILYYKIQQHF